MASLKRLHHGRLLPHFHPCPDSSKYTSAKSAGEGGGDSREVLHNREQAVIVAFHVELLAVNLAARSALLATGNANQYLTQVPPFELCVFTGNT